MKITSIILLIALLCFNSFSQDNKNYVSTWGMKIEIIPDVVSSNAFTLYELSNADQKNTLLQSLYNYAERKSNGGEMMFNLLVKLLDNTEFNKQKAYVLVSQLTNDIEIYQPYMEQNKIIFNIEKKEKQENHYVYIRIYKVNINEDKLEKFILQEGNEIKLEPVKL